MRISPFISLLLLILVSCSPAGKGSGSSKQNWSATPPLSCFSGTFGKVLFKSTLDIRDQNLTGFLLLKRTSDTSYRIVFANEIGMTLFDLGFTGGKFVVNYVFEAMNKKILLKLFEKDFRYLIFGVVMPGSGPFMKMETSLKGENGQIPAEILFSNPGIRMTMKLRSISQE